MASPKVKAGVRLLMAEASVGELYSIPLYPHICAPNLTPKNKTKQNY